MTKNPVYQALNAILRNAGRTLRILKYGLLEKDWLRVTDLDHELAVRLEGGKPGRVLVDIGLLLKTGDLPAAIAAANSMKVEDFPGKMEPCAQGNLIPARTLDGLVDLLPATSPDDGRECLQYVYVDNKRKQAVATDGHILLLKKVPGGVRESYLIDGTCLKIAALLNPIGFTIGHRAETKDAGGRVSTPAANVLTIAGNGWQLLSKVPVDYPQYWKIIPDRSKSKAAVWDSISAEIAAFLEKSMPLMNARSHMVHFTATEGIVKNEEISLCRKTDFSKEIFPLEAEQVIGLNAEILRKVLKFIGNRPASVTVGAKMTEGVVWQGEGFLALQMPLRTAEGDTGISRSELLGEGEMLRKAA